MISVLIGILIIAGVAIAIKIKDDEIRKSMFLKRIVICVTFAGLGFLLVGIANILIGG